MTGRTSVVKNSNSLCWRGGEALCTPTAFYPALSPPCRVSWLYLGCVLASQLHMLSQWDLLAPSSPSCSDLKAQECSLPPSEQIKTKSWSKREPWEQSWGYDFLRVSLQSVFDVWIVRRPVSYRNLRQVKQGRGKQWFSWAAGQRICRASPYPTP